MKIVDNLQITIKSVNIRFENSIEISKQPFALGLSLKQLDIVTTNENWKVEFVYRTNSDIPMRKLLKLEKLDIYWIHENP
jgi:vacuolar protein sorting-associated protein 13A/C